MFEDPYRYIDEKRVQVEKLSADKLALSKEAALKSMVLLKNQNEVLPLKADQKIAFIGPLVKDKRNVIGSWSAAGDWKYATDIWQALETKYGANKFLFAKGCNLVQDKGMIEKLNRDGAMLTLDPKSSQDLISEAVETAKQSDVVVAVLGEPFIMTGEAASRSEIGLFSNQMDLLKALKQTGKPIVLVLMNGRPMTLEWENANLNAILETWFAGTKAGDAIVDTLFGTANPSGKLSITFPRNVGQIPIYYNAKSTGRPFTPNEKFHSQYLDVPNTPLFPFGYGLSYTNFEYSDVSLSSPTLRPDQTLAITATIKNTGRVTGVETAQLYVRDFVGSITRPVKELKGFEKVELKPGESKIVTFKLTSDDLPFYDSDLKYVAEPGEFQVFVGPNSDVSHFSRFVFAK
ncbi:MAG: glycoside hydrolase family 3 C-terminal domain-containing protein [Leptolyngbya sp.]|nr:glycoside hydrolase family 3 C-terminal domain-containing protein [Candidatus Melainabacteria bacterium]